jgi:hypothetical protein
MTRSYTADRRRIAALRLTAQGISPSGDHPTIAGTVRRLLGTQAQDFAGAKWSVGLRTPGSTDDAVEAALGSGDIVRSWPMRGTLHLVPPEDLGWMLRLTADRTIKSMATRRTTLGLTDADIARVHELAFEHLSGGRSLSRDALLAVFDAGGVATASQRGYHLLVHLALTRTIVFGPVTRTAAGTAQQSFVLLDEWVPDPRRLEREEALGEFAVRYFTGHGPATVRDFAWWSSMTLKDARAGLAIARDRLEELELDGEALYLAAGTEPAPRAVFALPGFDEYLLGYQSRDAALAPEHFERIVPGKNGLLLPTIVDDGEVVGTWRRTVKPKAVVVDAERFDGSPPPRGFAAASRGYAEFIGRPLAPG